MSIILSLFVQSFFIPITLHLYSLAYLLYVDSGAFLAASLLAFTLSARERSEARRIAQVSS